MSDQNLLPPPKPKSVQREEEKMERNSNGPFNPPDEIIEVTRGKRGGIAFIVNGKRTDE